MKQAVPLLVMLGLANGYYTWPLRPGSLCAITKIGWDASDRCPEGTQCLPVPHRPAHLKYCLNDVCYKKDFCGGIANIQCKDGYACIEGNNNVCAQNGGADCGGCCVVDKCATVRCASGPCVLDASGNPKCLRGCKKTCGEAVPHGWSGSDDGGNHCNVCSCNDGNMLCTFRACLEQKCPAPGCKSDADCEKNQWCRVAKNGNNGCSEEKQCVPKSPEGGRCGGFTLPCYQEQCEEGLVCKFSEPTGDVPGTCVKPVAVPEPRKVGCLTACLKLVPHGYHGNDDGDNHCNTCTCDNGSWICTEKGCPARKPTCLGLGDVCYAAGVELPPPVRRRSECPAGTECVPNSGFAIGGEVAHTCKRAVCKSDADCMEGDWCRPKQNEDGTCSKEKVCVPFAKAGEQCGGLGPACGVQRCGAFSKCATPKGLLDAPGTCEGTICCFAIASCEKNEVQVTRLSCTPEDFKDGTCVDRSICCSTTICRKQ